jgi:hypothetical protein
MQDYLRGWLNELATRNLSKSYIQHLLIYLRATLNEAVKRQLIHYNYAAELKVPARLRLSTSGLSPSKTSPRYLRISEARASGAMH